MVNRAGTIFRRRNGATHKKSGTIFDKKAEQPPQNSGEEDKKTQSPSNEPPVVEVAPAALTLEELSQKSSRIIYRTKTVFPFVLFSDEIVVDEEKVTVTMGIFYKSGHSHSIMLKDIAVVAVSTAVFFATLRIVDQNNPQAPLIIRYLPKEEALKMRRTIMGLTIADKNSINLGEYPVDKVKEKAEEIGKAHESEGINI